jgi:hypothetical protein
LNVSIDPRSWQFYANSGQLGVWRNTHIQRGVCHLFSKDNDLFVKEVHGFVTAEVKAILSWGMMLFS